MTNPHGLTAANMPSRKLYAKLPSSAIIQTTHSGSGSFRQCGLKFDVIQCAEQNFGVTVRVDHHEGWLGHDTEASEDGTGVVADLRERQRVLVDESLERSIVARPRDTDEVDPPGPLLCCCFDRRSFCVADRSSRRPEPKSSRAAGTFSTVELTAANQWRSEPQQFGDACRAGGRSRVDSRLARC